MLKARKLFLFFSIFISVVRLNGQLEKTVHQSPIPSFAVYDLCWGSTTFLKNLSAAADTYTWNIYKPDISGNYTVQLFTSNATDVSYKFSEKGTYKVQLFADNGHTVVVTKFLNVDTITKADFDYQSCQGRFINLSRCASSYTWDFGNAEHTSSKEHSPNHYFTAYATYTPSLKASNNIKIDSLKKIVAGIPNFISGKFTYEVKDDMVYFVAEDSVGISNVLDYYWTWGDANKELIIGPEGRKVSHKYTKWENDEAYTAFLLVRDACNSNYSLATFTINGTNVVKGTSFYPNPPEFGMIHIATDRKSEINSIRIVNSFGIVMEEYVVTYTSKGVDIDLSFLQRGVYSITISFTGGDKITRKVVTGS